MARLNDTDPRHARLLATWLGHSHLNAEIWQHGRTLLGALDLARGDQALAALRMAAWIYCSAPKSQAVRPASATLRRDGPSANTEAMAKYDPLKRYLSRQKASLDLTFPEIERIVGAMLPKSAHRQQWWANETSPTTSHVQIAAWRDAGFRAALVATERVRFERVR